MCLAIPGEITALSERDDLPFAKVRFGGVTREVCLVCQPDAVVGDFVLVHVGMAIARIDREEAERSWQLLAELGQLTDLDDGTDPAFDATSPTSPTSPQGADSRDESWP